MEIRALGFDQWFEDKRSEALRPNCSVAPVTAVHRDSYLVKNNISEVFAELPGSFIYSAESSIDLPSVGDWALVQFHNDDTFAIIHGLLPRKSFLRRKTPGKKT